MEDPLVYVYDRRTGDKPEERVSLEGVSDFRSFRRKLLDTLAIDASDEFVVTNSSRQEINDDSSYEDLIVQGGTLYLLESTDQELLAPTDERIDYVPHYDTLVKSGIYEYYASEGQNPLPYAFAELIDNALTATAKNEGERNIDLFLYLEDSPTICVFDNGRGMTSKQLNHWAIYRLSKFLRNKPGGDLNETFLQEKTPRSLNSDISYFGVGGKQAIFFIGTACRMISKTRHCGDVHELSMSKDEFEAKEKERKSVFSGRIRNRRCGDSSHLQQTGHEILKKLIEEQEKSRDQFTAVFISGIAEKNVQYLTKNFVAWSRQLAHIYHYYLHGPQGNIMGRKERASSPFKQISITIHMKAGRDSTELSLHQIDDDMQTRYIRSAKATFDFKVDVPAVGEVEGVLRYHPFEYDHETYPVLLEAEDEQSDTEDVEDAIQPSRKARGNRAMFECFWNGRLIPYTTIDGLEFCEPSKPSKRGSTTIPLECYSRISGCLFTNDAFQVSTNKLTFIDLPVKLRERGNNIMYSVVTPDGRPIRDIRKHFHQWLRDCHENFDKEVQFVDQMETDIRRDDVEIKRRQHPWCVYQKIELDGKIYQTGDLVRTCRTNPIVCGRVIKFWLYGRHDGDTFANTGEMELQQEPAVLYNDVKFYPLTKLDRLMEEEEIIRIIKEEESRLPKKLEVNFPEGNEVKEKTKLVCGKPVGPVQVQVLNGKGESIGRLPGVLGKKLSVEQTVMCGGKEICQHVGEYSSKWFYWFRMIGELRNLGAHSMKLQAVVLDTEKQPSSLRLPSVTINFTVTEGPATAFKIAPLEGPYKVGDPFQLQLELFDKFNNPARLPPGSEPQLSAAGVSFAVKDGVTKSNMVTIRGVVATAKVNSSSGQTFKLKVTVSTVQHEPEDTSLRLIPGLPHSLECVPAGPVNVENRTPLQLTVHVKDISGNLTTDSQLTLVCKLSGADSLPIYRATCNSGIALFTGEDIVVKQFSGRKVTCSLQAKISVLGNDQISPIEEKILVTPSLSPSKIIIYRLIEGSTMRKQLNSEQEVSAPVGTTIEGLSFAVLDEAGKEVDVKLVASSVKVNWTNKLNLESIRACLLPGIPVPSSVSEMKYCEVSLSGMGVEYSFQVKPTVGGFKALKWMSTHRQVRVKQTENLVITIQCTDAFGNLLPKLPPGFTEKLKVTGSDLDSQELKIAASAEDTAEVSGIGFKKVDLGLRELAVEYQGIKAYVTLEVIAGSPSQVKFLHYEPQEPIYVYNESRLPAPLVVQLYDRFGNVSPEANVKIALGKTSGFKFEPPTHQQKTNEEGQVDFGQLTVSGSKGEYTITPRATMSTNQQVYGESLHIHIQPDSSKAVEIKVTFCGVMNCVAGTHLPDSEVSIIAEDLHVMTNVMAPHIAMGIKESLAEDIPENVQLISPPEAGAADSGVFYFRNVPSPERSGQYSIMINYISAEARLISPMYAIEVEPAIPCRLVPHSQPPTATVSNQARATNRQLVKNLQLQLRDVFNNICSQDAVKGAVTVTVMSTRNVATPRLAGNAVSPTFSLVKGVCVIKELLVKENCPGQDGEQYLLRFEVDLPGFPAIRIPPFDFQFLFYDDVKKQREMAQLTRQRDQLSEFLRTCSTMFQSSQQIINEYESKVREYAVQEQRMKQELRRSNVPPDCLVSADAVDIFIGKCTVEKEKLAQAPRRQCLLPAVGGHDPEILGKIAHLAQVVEDDIARVLSWHMASDMDCVVTMTTGKAKEVYRQSHGNQQVLPLDGIYRRNLPDWNRPLPHVKGMSRASPPGNPVYARDLLLFPRDPDNCKIVFGMLLGETIIIDSLDDATAYRQEVVKYTHCPTILTRAGDRIRSNGKFGGLQNRAPPLDRMRGAVFSAPLPHAYSAICQQMERLQAYRQVLMKHDTAKRELHGQKERMDTAEMASKREDMRKAEEKLKEIEIQLGIRSSDSHRQQHRPSPAGQASAAPSRRSQTVHQDNEPLAKRMRSSAARVADNHAQEDLGRRRSRPTSSAETPKKRSRYS